MANAPTPGKDEWQMPLPQVKMNGKCPTPQAQKSGKSPTLSQGGSSGIHFILPLLSNLSHFFLKGVQGQSIRWTKDQVVAVYGGNQKLSCVSPQQPTFVKNNKTITTTPDKYEISVAPQVNLFHLQVLNIVDSDHGSYYCVLGEQRVKIILNIGCK